MAGHGNKSEYELKELICEIGRRLYAKGFAAANDGNITIRLNEREFLCTPTMISKGYMKPEDICRVDTKGNQLAGKRKRTSEVLLHLSIYNQRPDINAVVHCHPPHATAFAVAHEPMPTARWIGFGLIWTALAVFSADTVIRNYRSRAVPYLPS